MSRLFRFHLFGDAGVVLWLEGMRGSKALLKKGSFAGTDLERVPLL